MTQAMSARPTASSVMTVTGPVSADELGAVLAHEHVFTNTMREYRGNGLLHDADLAVRELEDYAAHGGGTLVELTPVEGGRDPKRLAEVSLASGVRGSLAPVLAVSCCGVTNLRHTQADRGM